MPLSRRDLIHLLALAPTLARRSVAGEPMRLGEPTPFDPSGLRELARGLAAAPYRPPEDHLPAALAGLDYDQHRDIRFRPEMALWRGRGLDVEAQFFHLGHHFHNSVQLFEVTDGMAREILYTPALFDYGQNDLGADFPENLGFAGFRLHAPLNRADYLDEVAVFLGASYFRALGRGQRYGLSARAVAIDTGLPRPEEFPAFRAFWLERPAPGAGHLVVHALLDGPGLAGAYRFDIRPGEATTMEVGAHLYPRRPIELLGIAPLNSMFLFGPNDRLGVDDFRPRVHDSEGLQIWTGAGEWLWRPLVNPEHLRLSLFADDAPKGFGLLQRSRDFAGYQDLEARYERRPSLWVEPLDAWGRGHVRLIELPAAEEIHDNVVAFWVPAAPVGPGLELALRYRLHWCLEAPFRPALAECVATGVGLGGVPGQARDPNSRKFVLDFAGGDLAAIPAGAPVEAVASASVGRITAPIASRNDVTGGWRAFFDLQPEGAGPVELRARLRQGGATLTETWVYQWTA